MLSVFLGNAQKKQRKSFELSWEMNVKNATNNGLSVITPIVTSNSINNENIPTYLDSWNSKGGSSIGSYKIVNPKFSQFNETELGDVRIASVPSELTANVSISKSNGSNKVFLSMIPLVKEGSIVKRLVSFDLEYTLRNTHSKLKAVLVSDSKLSSGTWYKFSVDKTGVFKLDSDFLSSLGINVSNVVPADIKIIGNGGAILPELNSSFRYSSLQENSIYVSASGGSFNSSDYILFYAVGPHSWNTDNELDIKHNYNIYSEKAYYFISVDNGTGKRITDSAVINDATTDAVTTFTDFLFLNEEKVNLLNVGKQWFGDRFSSSNTQKTYNFNFENADFTSDIKLKVRAVSTSSSQSGFSVTLNDNPAFEFNFSGIGSASFVRVAYDEVSDLEMIDNEAINVGLTYNTNGNPEAEAYLDYIEIVGTKNLIASGSQFSFRNFLSKESSKVLEYTISNKANIREVWDVTDQINPKKIANIDESSSDFSFKENSGVFKEYVVLNDADYFTPRVVQNGSIPNQNLHGLKDVQYLVVTKKDFLSQAQRLADYHSSNSGLTSRVVDLEEIYNEFGSGAPDITAIRDFAKHLYDNATSDASKLKYLCLFGDSTYDYKGIEAGIEKNIVPVYLSNDSYGLVYSYVTDDYYGMMGDTEGLMKTNDKQDVATGRILVSNTKQAEDVVDKILNYYAQESFGDWRNEITFVADDLGNESEFILQEELEKISDLITLNKPQYNIKKLYSDAFQQVKSSGGDRYPDVNAKLANSVEKGSLIIDYFGHGGEVGWAEERLLSVPEILSWQNFNNLPLFITVTCDFSRFDNPTGVLSAGEEIVVSPRGGAASLISTTREVFISYGQSFNKNLVQKILEFNDEDYTISEALMSTKNEVPSSSGQHYFIFYLGDPAMKLKTPKRGVKVNRVINLDKSQADQNLIAKDTLKALSRIRLIGEVTDENGSLSSGFNGVLTTSIFDKSIDKETLDNDGHGKKMVFDVQDSKIFRGSTQVENGVFEIDFIVPKDIKIAYGKAKISLYAQNGVDDKGGFDLEANIGGINLNAASDTEGPVLNVFMNDESFVDGGNTNALPVLKITLEDASGINTSQGAIGHNITAILDGDVSNPIQLNEFYEAELGDFTKGSISYTLRDLEPGVHTIEIKAWDTYNNSSKKSLSFYVVVDSSFVLENVLNYPNPFINYTEFWFNHNKVNEELAVKIYIFTVSGKLVKSISQDIPASGSSLSRSISWDGLDDFGQKVGKGVYVYNLVVTSKSSGETAEKIEKLVLLQ
jgi:hypothetical protein